MLRRIITRLCVLAAGVDAQMDEQLHELKHAMHRHTDTAELEQMLLSLAEVVGGSGEVLPSEVGAAEAAPAVEGAAHEPLQHLLDRVDVLPGLLGRLQAVKAELQCSQGRNGLLEVAEHAAELINQQRTDLQLEQIKVTEILQKATTRLDEVAGHLASEAAIRVEASDDSAQVNANLLKEVRALDNSVRQGKDLVQVQKHVHSRIEFIDGKLREFREREKARLEEYSDRAERMRERVEALERETAQLQESVQREQLKASTDALTGIPNRLAFQQRLGEEFRHWSSSGVPLCVAIWDIDLFKSINDTYGHQAGDKALRVVAQHIARNLRKTDFVARYGGEEFVAILRGVVLEDVVRQADRIRESLSKLGLHFGEREVTITASCGVSVFKNGDTEEMVLKRADSALYRAKRAGRNRCFVG